MDFKEYYQKNKERIKEKNRKHYREVYYPKNKEKIKAKHREYARLRNKEERNKKERELYKLNSKKQIERVKARIKQRRKTDKEFVVFERLRSRFRLTFINKPKPKIKLNWKRIIEYLKPIPDDINNYDIHHIKPIESFNFVNDEGKIINEAVIEAFKPENHLLLTKEEHRKFHKNNKK